jgi:non-ribosomal peptide synthetase component F
MEETMVGFFANTMPVRVRANPDQSLWDYVLTIEKAVSESLKYQDIPLELIVNNLGIKRSASHSPLFQYGFVFQNFKSTSKLAGLDVEFVSNAPDSSRFELMMVLEQTQEGINGSIEFMTALFDDSTVEQFIRNFRKLIVCLLDNPNLPVSELPLGSENGQFGEDAETVFNKKDFDF